MNLHTLKSPPGSRKSRQRVGRGIGSGSGKTSGRGQKGQGSRSGGKKGAGFEGGQNPVHMRLPKRGFNNKRFATRYAVVNVGDLAKFEAGTTVTPESLVSSRVVGSALDGIKVLGDGELSVALTVKAHKFSQSAIAKIEAAGGKAEVI